MASEGTALIGLWFEGQKYFADSIKEECTEKYLDIFDDTSRWLDIYFSGKEPDFTPKILITGTPFRKSVAEIMLTIPYGKTMTYGEIANVIAKEKGIAKMSAQAVGGAVGHNSISIIIPCHRVVGTNGRLTGYAGGLDKKIQLLKLEKQIKYNSKTMEVLKMGINSIDAEDDQFAYRYDTQLLIDRRDKDLDEDEIADYITEHFEGNSLIAAGDEELVKIHFHTNEPWKILEYCNSVGEIYDIVVEDMIRQTNGLQG